MKTLNKLLLGLLFSLIPAACFAQGGGQFGGGANGAGVTITTVAGLNGINGKVKGTIAVVTDGATANDCTTGGGSTVVVCQYSGSTWGQMPAASAGATSFAAITGATNTAALLVGTGGSLGTSGSGTIAATSLEAKTWEAPGTIGSTTPNTGAFSTVSLTGQLSSTLATGTAPFFVTSTTPVANLSIGGNAATATSATSATTATSATNSLGLEFGATAIPMSATAPTANQCLAADGTASSIIGTNCGAGGGNVSTSGTPANHQYAIFSPDGTHITGVTPSTAGLPLVSNGTSADPSAQALPLASLVAPSTNGDQITANSGAWTETTPGIAINSITGTTYTVAAADRGDRDQFTGTAASAWTLPKAGSAGFGNNFFFTVPNFSANNVNVTITPTTSNCNGGLNCIVGQGQVAYLTSDPTANSGNGSYYAHIGWNTLSSGSFVTIAPSQFGGTVDLTVAVPISLGGTGQTTQQAGFNALAPTPTRAGDITYYNGTNYVNLAGNNSGTGCFQENSSGVPSFGTCGGSPTLDQVGNPAASKTFTMGANSLAFNWTTNAFNLDTAGATPTFGLASYTAAITNSPTLTVAGSYENAATPTFAEDSFGFQNVIGAGLNGTAQLTVTPAGTSGAAGYTFNTGGAAGADGNFIIQNGAHNLSIEVNNASNGQSLSPTDNFNVTMGSGKNLTFGGGGGASVTAFQNCGATATNNCFTIKEGAASPTGTTFRTLNSSSAVNFALLKGIVSNYNATATAGQGVDWIPCVTSQKSETGADAAVLSCTPASAVGTYKVHVVLSLSAANAATIGWTATWTDSNGNAQTPTNLALTQVGTAAPALTFTTSAAGNYYGDTFVDVNNAGTAIVVKTTFSGTSIAYKISAWVERTI